MFRPTVSVIMQKVAAKQQSSFPRALKTLKCLREHLVGPSRWKQWDGWSYDLSLYQGDKKTKWISYTQDQRGINYPLTTHTSHKQNQAT